MGDYTYAVFKDYLLLRFGRDTAFSSPTDYYGIWINSAYRRLCASDRLYPINKLYIFPELETDVAVTTTEGTGYVPTPSDCQIVRRLYHNTDKAKLKWMSFGQYVGYTDRATSTSRAAPTQWHRRGTNILLHPTPDNSTDSLQIFYKKRPVALSGTNVTVLGAEWDEPILELAHHIGKTWLNEWDVAEKSKKALIEMEADLISAMGAEEKDRQEIWRADPAYTEPSY